MMVVIAHKGREIFSMPQQVIGFVNHPRILPHEFVTPLSARRISAPILGAQTGTRVL